MHPGPRVWQKLLVCVAWVASCFAAEEGQRMQIVIPTPTLLSSADVAFDVRVDIISVEKSDAAAFAFVEKEFARDPRPHVKARYAEYLIGGKNWGAPEGQAERGTTLAIEALKDGSVHAMQVMGWECLSGNHFDRDPALGLMLLQNAAATGNVHAMLTLGDAYFRGVGVAANPFTAETWFRKGADRGKPHSLFRLGQAYEEGRIGDRANLDRACALYYEAGIRGSGSARKRLDELMAKGHAPATRARKLIVLWYAAFGADYQTKQVREAVTWLEATYPEDPQVWLAIGRLQCSGQFGFRDFKKAYELFDRAAKAGLLDARSQRARLLAEGEGVKKDPAAALAEWYELEAMGHPETLSMLGYYHYWGARVSSQLSKDPAQAYAYAKRAADLGDIFGQINVATCYEDGIGVEKDYALAAQYYRAAAWRGSLIARERVPRLLAHVK